MIIHDFYICESSRNHLETDSVLLVNADTILPLSVASKHFQMIGRRDSKILQAFSFVNHNQLPEGNLLDTLRQFSGELLIIDHFCFFISKSQNHL